MAERPLESIIFPGDDTIFVNTPKIVAPEFDPAELYSKGDHVFYNRKLYIFTADHAAGAWSGSDVAEITVGEELTDLKGALDEIGVTKSSPVLNWLIGCYISSDGTVINSGDYASRSAITYMIPVQGGDIIDSTNLPLYDDSNHVLTCWLCTYVDGVFQARVNPYSNRKYSVPSSVNAVRFSFNIATVTMTDAIISTYFKVGFYVKDMAYSKSLELWENMTYNCTNFLYGATGTSRTHNGVKFIWNGNGTCTISGTATAVAFANLIYKTSSLPDGFAAGGKYWFETNARTAKIQIYPLLNGEIISGTSVDVQNEKKAVIIPSNANGLIVRMAVANGTTVNETAYVRGYTSLTNDELTKAVEDATSITNNYEFNSYENTYNVTASPTITTDTNNYLAATGDSTDRTAAIAAMLSSTGICHLGPGTFYVKNLSMPNGTSLIGSGMATRLQLISGDNACAIKPGSNCSISDMWIMGAAEITTSETIGTRHGILWQGTYTSNQSAPGRTMISNVKITSFTGGGITCTDTGTPVSKYIEVVNAVIHNCNVGIYVQYSSEFHKFTNVSAQLNYYGCINNGGNNVFVNCDFSSSKGVAFLMDNSSSQSPNNSHGSAIGCVFNHTASNTGVGIKILNCDWGFIFTGCQIFFSQIDIEDSDGVVVSNSNFGDTNCNITIKNGGTILFANNMHGSAPAIAITNNDKVHFANCYVRSTGASVAA